MLQETDLARRGSYSSSATFQRGYTLLEDIDSGLLQVSRETSQLGEAEAVSLHS
jgi:hypothetical protein